MQRPHASQSSRRHRARFVAAFLLWIASSGATTHRAGALPPPIVNPHSTEICLNSRISHHGGWGSGATEQMLADVLHATARAPVTGASRTIYAATPTGVYAYDPLTHALVLHKSGDQRSDATAAFEVGIAAGETIDAGAAMHLGQLEAAALWTGTVNQLASCPRASATTYANGHWDLPEPVDIVTSFGMRGVPGLTANLVAISSDGSLPNPDTDGSVYLDLALNDLAYGSTFAEESLSPAQASQILWAAYGCSDHRASGTKGGLTCASAVANYYLTKRVYWVGPDGVYRYHNRMPPGTDLTTRDHRIESIRGGDVRPSLRTQVPDLPAAPAYMILCVGSVSDWPVLEVGFAAMGAVLESSSMGLQGYVTAGLTAGEQAGIRQVTSIPAGDIPWAIVSAGRRSDPTGLLDRVGDRGALVLTAERTAGSGDPVTLRFDLPSPGTVDLKVYDAMGRALATLSREHRGAGVHGLTWNGRDREGRRVAAGAYFFRLRAGNREADAHVVLVP